MREFMYSFLQWWILTEASGVARQKGHDTVTIHAKQKMRMI